MNKIECVNTRKIVDQEGEGNTGILRLVYMLRDSFGSVLGDVLEFASDDLMSTCGCGPSYDLCGCTRYSEPVATYQNNGRWVYIDQRYYTNNQ